MLLIACGPPPPAVPQGFLTTEGIEYTVIEAGEGEELPAEGDFVTIDLILTMQDDTEEGTVLFNSYENGNSLTFPIGLDQMVEGIEKAAAQMSVGTMAAAVIPPEFGFGAEGGGPVPPDTTLTLELEMLNIQSIGYETVEEGTGESPETGQFVSVHYVGMLEDGTEFDSSYDNGQPAVFQIGVGQVILGWDGGIPRMRVGEKAILTIPPALGYGATGAGDLIPPDATLIFEVELLEIIDPTQGGGN